MWGWSNRDLGTYSAILLFWEDLKKKYLAQSISYKFYLFSQSLIQMLLDMDNRITLLVAFFLLVIIKSKRE